MLSVISKLLDGDGFANAIKMGMYSAIYPLNCTLRIKLILFVRTYRGLDCNLKLVLGLLSNYF